MNKYYDLVVIGAGSGGLAAAKHAAKNGLSVAICESKLIGGTCVNYGCIPKKVLFYAAQYQEVFTKAISLGWIFDTPKFNWSTLIETIDNFIQDLRHTHEKKLDAKNIDFIKGSAEFLETNVITINGLIINFKNLIIASGSTPNIIDIPGKEYCYISDDIFSLQKLPKHLTIVGGGYIAVELASFLNNFGCSVHIIHRGERILKEFDSEVALILQNILLAQGIKISLNTEVTKIEKLKELYNVYLNTDTHISTELILLATGRHANIEQLNTNKLNLLRNKKGYIEVNSRYQTNMSHIYAIGDVIENVALTPVAIREGIIAVNNILNKEHKSINYQEIPTAIFCHPSLGCYGLTEDEAAKKYNIEVFKTSFIDLENSVTKSGNQTFIKVIINIDNDRILGFHIMANNAAEIIQSVALALANGVTRSQLKHVMALHPTIVEELIYLLNDD